MDLYSAFVRPALFKLDAEQAHAMSIKALKMGMHPKARGDADPRLQVELAGLKFSNPLGMAAGYDKNADAPHALLALGFGHVEVGTIAPQPQPGNPKPRIFRLVRDRGVINRLGFNSGGHDLGLQNLKRPGSRLSPKGLVGANLGANKLSEDFAADYVVGIERFQPYVDYITINISSPNTPGLRALQGKGPLDDLLMRVSEARLRVQEGTGDHVPVFLKVAPDLNEAEIDTIADAVRSSSIDALLVSNTTLSRHGLRDTEIASEAGGLSGAPLFERSTIILAKFAQRLAKETPLIGIGGIHSAETAWQKMEAGASLVQLYSGLIYGGPKLPQDILAGFSKRLSLEKLSSISDIVGRSTNEWASRALPPA